MKVQFCLIQARFIDIHEVFAKKVGYFSNRVRVVLENMILKLEIFIFITYWKSPVENAALTTEGLQERKHNLWVGQRWKNR